MPSVTANQLNTLQRLRRELGRPVLSADEIKTLSIGVASKMIDDLLRLKRAIKQAEEARIVDGTTGEVIG
jgi:hypothetical protein